MSIIPRIKHDSAVSKLLSDNRHSYFAQSAATRDGRVPPYTHNPMRTANVPAPRNRP